MPEQKHTPGPWIVTTDLRQGDEIICDMLNEKGYVAITKGQKLAYWRNDAKLIAAAPDLLDALECLKREVILSDVDMDYIDSHFKPWLDKARAAIDKATQ